MSTTPSTFRKRPVEIEAMPWDGTAEAATRIIDWVLEHGGTARYSCKGHSQCKPGTHVLAIETLEGVMEAPPGWWILRGVQGEFYPCQPEIFEATYEAVAQA